MASPLSPLSPTLDFAAFCFQVPANGLSAAERHSAKREIPTAVLMSWDVGVSLGWQYIVFCSVSNLAEFRSGLRRPQSAALCSGILKQRTEPIPRVRPG